MHDNELFSFSTAGLLYPDERVDAVSVLRPVTSG